MYKYIQNMYGNMGLFEDAKGGGKEENDRE
jgi:hypothetical protein